jgi:hypothetical protein
VNFAAFGCEKLHFLFDRRKNQNLLIFVQLGVLSDVKDVDQFSGGVQSEQVIDLATAFVKQKFDVSFVQDSLLAEVRLPNLPPHLLALARSAQHWFRLVDELDALVTGNVGQTAVGLLNA